MEEHNYDEDEDDDFEEEKNCLNSYKSEFDFTQTEFEFTFKESTELMLADCASCKEEFLDNMREYESCSFRM